MSDTNPARDLSRITSFLSVLQLSDSAFPSGRYTLSYGLEALTQAGLLGAPPDPSTLMTLLRDCIRLGVAPSDGVALACAHRAASRGARLDVELVTGSDHRLTAVKLARETREASTRTGHALLDTARAAFGEKATAEYAVLVDAGDSPGNHAVVLGVLTARLGVPLVEAVAGELYAFATGWASAAVRLALIDHRTAQYLLHKLRPVAAAAALRAADRNVADTSSCTPLLDVMAMRHEQAELRLFAS